MLKIKVGMLVQDKFDYQPTMGMGIVLKKTIQFGNEFYTILWNDGSLLTERTQYLKQYLKEIK